MTTITRPLIFTGVAIAVAAAAAYAITPGGRPASPVGTAFEAAQ